MTKPKTEDGPPVRLGILLAITMWFAATVLATLAGLVIGLIAVITQSGHYGWMSLEYLVWAIVSAVILACAAVVITRNNWV